MIRLDLLLIARDLGASDRHFITREYGAKVYPFLHECIVSTSEEGALVLVFPPNQLLDVSFADETIIRIGKEVLEDKYGQKAILLQGMTRDSIENVEAAIHYQRLHLAFLSLLPDEKWEVIGPLETALASTLNIVNVQGQLTAPELANQLDIAINTASNRLKRLFDLHLVRRHHTISETGLTYIYSFWQWNT